MSKPCTTAQCKLMTVEMHPFLLKDWFCADIEREVRAAGAHVLPTGDLCDPGLVLWSRNVVPALENRGGQVQLTATKEPCDRALYLMSAENVAMHVVARSLTQQVTQIRDMVACTLTVVLYGTTDYFKKHVKQIETDSEYSNKPMTKIELDMAITDLLVGAGSDTERVSYPSELALLVVQMTKALASAPDKLAKRHCDEQADFYMRGDSKNCVTVDTDGQGVSRLWQQMIAVLPMSSLETSRALCAQYKTPQQLVQALDSPNSVNEIADIGVARAAIPGSRARRIGPEFARKLHKLFTSEDGNALLE